MTSHELLAEMSDRRRHVLFWQIIGVLTTDAPDVRLAANDLCVNVNAQRYGILRMCIADRRNARRSRYSVAALAGSGNRKEAASVAAFEVQPDLC